MEKLPNKFSTIQFLELLEEKGENITFADVYYGIWLPKKKATIASWYVESRRIEKILLPAIGNIPIKDLSPKTNFLHCKD